VPFLACGDLSGWDADRNYELDLPDVQQQQQQGGGLTAQPGSHTAAQPAAAAAAGGYVSLDPVQKPVHPAYKTALEQRRNQGKGS
jgi:hypothetical protein